MLLRQAFLSAGLEPPELRIRYLADLETAGAELAHLAARSRGSTGSSEAVAVINQELLVYAGQVEAARTNNRQDFPVGAAYLRASDEMRNSILPTASGSTRPPHAGLYDDYERGASARDRVVLVVAGGVVLALLVATQVLVALRARRVLNAGLVGATVVVAAVGVGPSRGRRAAGSTHSFAA